MSNTLEVKGLEEDVDYIQCERIWGEPFVMVETRLLSPTNDIESVRLDRYFSFLVNERNKEEGTELYKLGTKTNSRGTVYSVSIIKLIEEDEDV